MGSAIGQLLPLALGIAVSPIAVIATIQLALSPRAKTTGLAFLAGWILGIAVAVVVFTLLTDLAYRSNTSIARPVSGIVQIAVGALLIFMAVRQWRGRPVNRDEAKLPSWMATVGTMTAPRGFVLGLLLSAVESKNLVMSIAAGIAIGQTRITVWQEIVAVVIFVVIAGATVIVVTLASLVSAGRMRPALMSLKDWLASNVATIMAALLLVLAAVIVGDGIGQF